MSSWMNDRSFASPLRSVTMPSMACCTSGGADEASMAEIQLGQDVGALHPRLPLDEARVPRIEVIIRPRWVGCFALGDVSEGRDHRLVPAGDVNQDLADAPAPEPHAAQLL